MPFVPGIHRSSTMASKRWPPSTRSMARVADVSTKQS
jgi:hypothetical protein